MSAAADSVAVISRICEEMRHDQPAGRTPDRSSVTQRPRPRTWRAADGLPLPAGRCPVPGCGDPIDRTRLMCRRDWYLVPKQLRDRVWATWRSGQGAASREHQQAVLRRSPPAASPGCQAERRQLIRFRLLPGPGQRLDPAG